MSSLMDKDFKIPYKNVQKTKTKINKQKNNEEEEKGGGGGKHA